MHIKLPEALVWAIGIQKLKEFDISEDSMTWQRYVEIELSRITITQVKTLRELCLPHEGIRGQAVVIKDIDTWIKACEKPGAQRCRKLEHFDTLLVEYLIQIPGHRLFKKHDKDGDVGYVAVSRVFPTYEAAKKEKDLNAMKDNTISRIDLGPDDYIDNEGE